MAEAPKRRALEENRQAAEGLKTEPVNTPCGTCPRHYLDFEVVYEPRLSNLHTEMRTAKRHSILGPEMRTTEGPFNGYQSYAHPITAGKYSLVFDFQEEDLRFRPFLIIQPDPDALRTRGRR